MIRSHHHARTVFAFLAVALVANVGALARGQDEPPEPPKKRELGFMKGSVSDSFFDK